MSITVSAPGKLMLFGEHAVLHGYPCIVAAVDQRLRIECDCIDDAVFQLDAQEVGVFGYRKSLSHLGEGDIPKAVRFVEYALKNLQEKHVLPMGVFLRVYSDFTSTFGFGSSSAVTVCTVAACNALFHLQLSLRDMFDICYKTVLDVQGKGSGFDLAAAIWGGVLSFVQGGESIEPIALYSNTTCIPLVVGYSGEKVETVRVIDEVNDRAKMYPHLFDRLYESMGSLYKDAVVALSTADWQKVGLLMDINQGFLESLGVSCKKLSIMIHASREAGAYGAKISGSGKGDCMIALTDDSTKQNVCKAIEKAGGEVLDVIVGGEGLKIIHN